MKPRYLCYAASLATLFAVALPSAPAGALPVSVVRSASTAGITGGALFGGTNSLVADQGALGRKLAIVRFYYYIGQNFSGHRVGQVMAAGGTVLASLDVPHSSGISYASIAAGHQDTAIRTWLTQAEQDAVANHLAAVYVSFEHEADAGSDQVLGTPAEFVKAWDHIHSLAARAHLNVGTGGRLRWALILEHFAYFPNSLRPHWALRLGYASQYWPGTSNVNVVAADGYNRGGCRIHKGSLPSLPSQTPGAIFGPVLTWAHAHGGLPVFIAEWASAYYSGAPAWQAKFIGLMKSYVLANPKIAAVMYWDNKGFYGCSFAVDGHPLSIAALASMGQVVNGHLG